MSEPGDLENARLQRRLEEAEQELCQATRKEQTREGMLQRLEQHLQDNGFADLLITALNASRRRRA